MSFMKYRFNRALYWAFAALALALITTSMVLTGKGHATEMILFFVCAPRLHDIGRSSWWAVLAIVAEFAIVVPAAFFLPMDQVLVVSGFFFIGVVGLMIWLGVIPGQPVANRWGDPPPAGLRGWKGQKQSKAVDVAPEPIPPAL